MGEPSRRGARGWVAAAWLALVTGAWWLGGRPAGERELLGRLALSWLALAAGYFLLSRRPGRARCLAFARTTALAVAVWLVLELPAAIGLLDYRVLFALPGVAPWHDPWDRPDPVLLTRRRPNATFARRVAGGDLARHYGARADQRYEVRVAYDANGFRNPPGMATARVIVLGDERIEAPLLATAETLPSRLAAQLGVPVANLGQHGYGPQQELEVLRRYGLPLRPQVCVWTVFEGDDLADLRRYASWTESGSSPAMALDGWATRSFWRSGSAWLLSLRPPPSPSPDVCEGLVKPPKSAPVRQWFLRPNSPLRRGDLAALETLQSLLSAAAAACARQNVHLIVALLPDKLRVYGRWTRFPPDSDAVDWVPNDLPRRLAGLLAEAHIEARYVDLTAPLVRAAEADGRLFFPTDTGYSPAGQAAIAQALAEIIRPRL